MPPHILRDPVGVDAELLDQPALPDSGGSGDRDEADALLATHRVQQLLHATELIGATNERRLDESLARARSENADRPPGAHRLCLALELTLVNRLEDDRCRCSLDRGLVGQDVARAGRRLQPRRSVHHVARHHSLVGRADADRRFAGDDTGPRVEVVAEGADRVDHLEARPNSTLRVILVRDRCPPHRHHRIADELLDRPAVARDRLAGGLEIPALQGTHLLGVAPVGEAREPDQIGEEDADEATFGRWARCGLRRGWRRGLGQGLGAGRAEARVRPIRLTARGAGRCERGGALVAELAAGAVLGSACRADHRPSVGFASRRVVDGSAAAATIYLGR